MPLCWWCMFCCSGYCQWRHPQWWRSMCWTWCKWISVNFVVLVVSKIMVHSMAGGVILWVNANGNNEWDYGAVYCHCCYQYMTWCSLYCHKYCDAHFGCIFVQFSSNLLHHIFDCQYIKSSEWIHIQIPLQCQLYACTMQCMNMKHFTCFRSS